MNSSMETALKVLGARSREALKMAKLQLLHTKIENEELRKAIEYYASNWDDTLHPGIVALACEAVGGSAEDSLAMQVPLLFLTAAIDIHDDILDESLTKNGKETVYGKFGKDMALLVGDGVLMKGMAMLYSNGRGLPTQKITAISSIIEAAFTEAGDAHTAETGLKKRMNIDPEEYLNALKKKGAILEAHARIGAVMGNGTRREIERMGEYGRSLGLLITLRDEFIDILDAQELRDRMKEGYLPLPIIYAFKNTTVKKRILSILSKSDVSERDAEAVANIVSEEETVKSLKGEMKNLANRTLRMISSFDQKDLLALLATASLESLWDAA